MIDFVSSQLENTIDTLQRVHADKTLTSTLVEAAEFIAEALKKRGKLIIAGNGGSAADAQHLAAEFVSRLTIDRPALCAIALTTDSSVLTALSNDYGYDQVFKRQIEAIGQPDDVFLGISTSGKSPNILRALRQCQSIGIRSIGLTGNNGGEMATLCDFLIAVPSHITQNIQESHLAIEHILCGLVERFYFGVDRFPDICRGVNEGESNGSYYSGWRSRNKAKL